MFPEAYIQVVWYRKDTELETRENPVLVIEQNDANFNVHKIRPGDALWVGQVAKANTSTDFYIVSLKVEDGSRNSNFHGCLTFSYPKTGQKIPVIVSYEPEASDVDWPSTRYVPIQQGWSPFFVGLVIIAITVLFILGINYFQSPVFIPPRRI